MCVCGSRPTTQLCLSPPTKLTALCEPINLIPWSAVLDGASPSFRLVSGLFGCATVSRAVRVCLPYPPCPPSAHLHCRRVLALESSVTSCLSQPCRPWLALLPCVLAPVLFARRVSPVGRPFTRVPTAGCAAARLGGGPLPWEPDSASADAFASGQTERPYSLSSLSLRARAHGAKQQHGGLNRLTTALKLVFTAVAAAKDSEAHFRERGLETLTQEPCAVAKPGGAAWCHPSYVTDEDNDLFDCS